MNLANKRKLLSIDWPKLVWLVAILALSWVAHGGMAIAIPANPPPVGHNMPQPGDFTQGNNVYLVVAGCSASTPACTGAYQLNGPVSTTRIYIRKTAFDNNNGLQFTITDGKAGCTTANNEDDISASNNTNFTLEGLKYGSNNAQDPWNGGTAAVKMNGSFVLKSSSMNCGGYAVSVPHGVVTAANLGTGQFAGYYAFQLTATLTSGAGWNSFSLFSAHAQMSYYSSGNDKFGIKAAPGTAANPTPDPGNFALPFAPNCSLSSTKNYAIRWYDADAGRPNQNNQVPIHTFLYGWDQHSANTSTVALNIYPNASSSSGPTSNPIKNIAADGYQYGGGGNNVGGNFLLHNLKPGWVYSWQWNNIYVANGIQFDLPFDSFYSTNQSSYDCSLPPTPIISCSVGAQANVPPGQPITNLYTVNFTATGYSSGGNFSVQMSPSPGAYVTGPNPNPHTVVVPINSGNWSSGNIYFSGHLDYQGNLQAIVTDPYGATKTCPGSAAPVVAPYFQVWQNDAAAGGGFNNPAGCPNAYPAYVSPKTALLAGNAANSDFYGGIRANSADYKSITDFGAVALGLIPNPAGEDFLSILPSNPLFANSGVPHSGYFNSSSANPNHCAYDFYDNTQDNPTPFHPNTFHQSDIDNCDPADSDHRCQYIMAGNLRINSLINIPQNTQVTVYVSGDVTINSDITYGSFNPTDRRTIPYFTIITQGDITLTDNARQLDGLYIAQPKPLGSGIVLGTGVFATCDSQCPDQLIVNGAVIAQHVELLRAHGSSKTLGGAAIGNIGYAPAEIFNFTPAMILGYPEFNPQPPGNPSLFSLPPVF